MDYVNFLYISKSCNFYIYIFIYIDQSVFYVLLLKLLFLFPDDNI